MTPQQAARELNKRATELRRQAQKAQRVMAARAVDKAKGLSRGTLSVSDLRRLDHPYSRADPNPPLDPSTINYQTGNLYRNWRSRCVNSGGGMVATVWNASKEAQFLDPHLQTGRSKSIARPLAAAVTRDLKQAYPASVRASVQEALKI